MNKLLNRFNGLKKHSRKGFTMVELIIVIMVIAVLVAILAPAVGNALDRANQVADQADARTLMTAAAMARLSNAGAITAAQVIAEIQGGVLTLPNGFAATVHFSGHSVIGVTITGGGRSTGSTGTTIGVTGGEGGDYVNLPVPIAHPQQGG
jgi:prepilin-type N-terminal cleavage/methylation domain-containing protein